MPPKAQHAPPYLVFGRAEWARLRANTPLALSAAELTGLLGVNETASLAEVAEIYLPLSRLLNLHFIAALRLNQVVEHDFLGRPGQRIPYVIAIAGSVAVGKSSFARILQAVLSRWPDHPRVDLVTTDGFLQPTSVLTERGLMRRKGFPESYDLRRMLDFLAAVKAGEAGLGVPAYSHETYDLVPGDVQRIDRPDILIFEGLNVLQAVTGAPSVASDYFDFSIYLDADPAIVESWYVRRFLLLQRTVFQRPSSYFHHYKDLDPAAAEALARQIWHDTNLPNLRDNIQPTRERARLVIRKSPAHDVEEIWLRRL